MGKRVIHDTEMMIDEDTGVLTVRFPGWREDPTRSFSFTPGGGGAFPIVGGQQLSISPTEMNVETDEPFGVKGSNIGSSLQITNEDTLGGDALLLLRAEAEGQLASVRLVANSNVLFQVFEDGGPAKVAFFGAAGAERQAPINNVTDLAETMAALNLLLAYWRDRGDILI
jgi:hypothetical protein